MGPELKDSRLMKKFQHDFIKRLGCLRDDTQEFLKGDTEINHREADRMKMKE